MLSLSYGIGPVSIVRTPEPLASGSALGTLHVDFSFVLDQLSLVMLLVVTGVGFLIHVYSVGYMSDDEGYARYFCYLNLFLFFMTVLVLAGNALVMFVGWEGVGLASYLLIGFWFQKKSAADAGKKAFIVNRIGDFGFLIGMFLLLANFGTLTFSEIGAKLAAHPGWQGGVLTVIALCLMLGAAGKSAQLPLYIWLPDAMEGPTPVSALIHAATMVTAGVYMVARTHVLFDHSPFALSVVAIVGAATAHLCRHHRPGAERHQARAGLLHHLAARLHVPGLRRGGLLGGHLPPDDPRLLQGAALPCGGLGDSRHRRRAGSAQDGRPAQEAAGHLLDHDRCRSGHRRIFPLRRILLQGRNSLRGLFAGNQRQECCGLSALSPRC